MNHACQLCSKSIKETGRLKRVVLFNHYFLACKKCRLKVKIAKFMEIKNLNQIK